jgi:hypothetical protein
VSFDVTGEVTSKSEVWFFLLASLLLTLSSLRGLEVTWSGREFGLLLVRLFVALLISLVSVARLDASSGCFLFQMIDGYTLMLVSVFTIFLHV